MSNRLDKLLAWCKLHGIVINDAISLVTSGDGSISVRAVRDLTQDTAVVKIPKSAILSTRTIAAASVFEECSHLYRDDPLVLATALFIEMQSGLLSPFFGYLQSLPAKVSIANVWPHESEALRLLKGTPAHSRITTTNILGQAREFFRETALPLIQKFANDDDDDNASSDIIEDQESSFLQAYAFVSSRAFVVDAYHGLAMVPIADAFNHTSQHNVQLQTDFHVCTECGSVYECKHDDDGTGTHTEVGIVNREPDTCDMVTARSVAAGDEVFNTYSDGQPMLNDHLLAEYGFVLPGNGSGSISREQLEKLRRSVREPNSPQVLLALEYLEQEVGSGDP